MGHTEWKHMTAVHLSISLISDWLSSHCLVCLMVLKGDNTTLAPLLCYKSVKAARWGGEACCCHCKLCLKFTNHWIKTKFNIKVENFLLQTTKQQHASLDCQINFNILLYWEFKKKNWKIFVNSSWIFVFLLHFQPRMDTWECTQSSWSTTAKVLRHHKQQLETQNNSNHRPSPSKRRKKQYNSGKFFTLVGWVRNMN